MKQTKIVIAFIIFLFLFSCEEVIQINLNSANPIVVVEGNISINNVCNLKLSYTSDYFNNDTLPAIENAVITLSDSTGGSEVLMNLGNGNYKGESILGKSNTKYTLSIKLNNEVYEGSSMLNTPVAFESLTFEKSDFERPNPLIQGETKVSYNMILVFTDDISTANFYLIKIHRSGQEGQSNFQLLDDKFNGSEGFLTYSPMMRNFHLGDTINVEVYSVDENTYSFYNQLNDISGRGMGMMSTPYNPTSNFGIGVMGYFVAWAVVDSTFIVEE